MTKLSCTLWTLFVLILLVITGCYLFHILGILLFPTRVTVMQQLSLYQWVALGMLIYDIFQLCVRKNIEFLETMSHEWTHIFVAMLFLRRVHSFHAEERTGLVQTSGRDPISHVPQSLAPYCLPVITYLLLAVRCLIAESGLWIFDILIGITLSFYLFCFEHQTGSYQTDINRYPLFFSYLYIWTCRLLNTAIILVAFFPQYNVFTSFWRFLTTAFDYLCMVFQWVVALF